MLSGYKGLIKPPPGTPINPFHPLSQGSICHLPMNEGSGSRVYDISGHGNHGTLKNMSPNAQNSGWGGSKFGGGLQFDGVNDYVDCGNDASLDITDAITVSAWIYPTGTGDTDHRYFLYKEKYRMYYDGQAGGKRVMMFVVVDNIGKLAWTPADSVPLDTWSHIAGVFNGTNVITYVNGVEYVGTVTGGNIDDNSAYDLLIGGQGSTVRTFNGSIDSVRIYNRALSAEEIKILYHDPFCNLLRVPVRYVPAAPEIIELLTTISATTSTSAPNVLMLRELASTIAATTSVSAADVDVLRELAATVASVTLTSTIELLIVSLRELSATVATVTSTSTPDLNVLRELTSTIDATTSISVASLNVLRELLSTIEVTTSTSASEMKVLRELEAIIEATTALSAIELAISVWITSNPTITRLKSEGWFE